MHTQVVLSQANSSKQKRLKLRSFTLARNGNLKKRNFKTIVLSKKIKNFKNISVYKTPKKGSKAKIILKKGSRKTDHQYRLTKQGMLRNVCTQ